MEINEIKKLLHHREPYLMVSKVGEFTHESIHSFCVHRGDEAHLKGHFPGTPVVPGAMIQEFCTQSAGILLTQFHSPVKDYNSETTKGFAIGVLNKVEFAKYLDIVKPDIEMEAKVDLVEAELNLFKFKARVYQSGKLKAKINFNLVNISDAYLKG